MTDLISAGNSKQEETKGVKNYGEQVQVPTLAADPIVEYMSRGQLEKSIERTRKLMTEAAKRLDFIEAAQYRDELLKLQEILEKKV